MAEASVIVVRNVHAGSQSDTVVREVTEVLNQLHTAARKAVPVYDTQCKGDGVRIGKLLAQQLEPESTKGLDVVVFGGDGTVSEVVNGFMAERRSNDAEIRIAVFPSGTANALYAAMYAGASDSPSNTRSITALIDSLASDKRSLKPLSPTVNRLLDKSGSVAQTTFSLLVTSHALHAAILADADTKEMRAAHEGIERFKVAARQNSTLWIPGSLTLQPPSKSPVLRYSPSSHQFEPVDSETAPVELEGPFIYLNAMITDRLEEQFVPAPLSSPWRSTKEALSDDVIDVVAIRPTRDSSLSGDDSRAQFAQKRLMDVQIGMYSQGSHIDLTYADSKEPIVEYFRCSAYAFTPDDDNEPKSRLICMDGTIAGADAFNVARYQGKAPLQIWW